MQSAPTKLTPSPLKRLHQWKAFHGEPESRKLSMRHWEVWSWGRASRSHCWCNLQEVHQFWAAALRSGVEKTLWKCMFCFVASSNAVFLVNGEHGWDTQVLHLQSQVGWKQNTPSILLYKVWFFLLSTCLFWAFNSDIFTLLASMLTARNVRGNIFFLIGLRLSKLADPCCRSMVFSDRGLWWNWAAVLLAATRWNHYTAAQNKTHCMGLVCVNLGTIIHYKHSQQTFIFFHPQGEIFHFFFKFK